MNKTYWSIPRLWEGETVINLAGGPSLTQNQVDYIKDKCKVIAINTSYQLAPWADLLYFCDARWYHWHKDNQLFKDFKGIKVTLRNFGTVPDEVKKIDNLGSYGLSLEPTGIMTGHNSGYQSINLAVLLGVKRILLLGYDMQWIGGKSHWHKGHPVKIPEKSLIRNMLPRFDSLKGPLKKAGVKVINCSPNSLIKTFPKQSLQEAL